jgi:capsule polysaccharide export protein KpsE/RkpR
MSSLKEQVIEMVSSIEDERLLELVKADIEYFNDKNTDIIDELNVEDREELMNLLNEPDEKDTMTEDEYKAATAKWRTK